MRRHFRRRAVVFLAAVILLAAGLSTVLRWGARDVLRLLGVPAGWVGIGETLLATAFTVLVVTAVLVGAATRRVAEPVEEVMAALGRAADGDFSARVPEHGSPEARTLARSFNAMAERLQRHEAERRNLFTDISHELRTPLTVVQGTLEGMLDGVYPRDAEHLSMSLEEIQVLGRLIEDLRTLATAESAGLELTKAPTDLAALAGDAVASFEGQAAAGGVTLRLAADHGLPPVDVDAERIRQVLNNLLSNAIRYTPRGGTVQVRYAGEGAERVRISVQDTGVGIPPEDLPHVFDRFHKSRDSRGSGLGLTIARSLVEAHGGEISAQSRAGQGTSIDVVIPIHDPG